MVNNKSVLNDLLINNFFNKQFKFFHRSGLQHLCVKFVPAVNNRKAEVTAPLVVIFQTAFNVLYFVHSTTSDQQKRGSFTRRKK